MLLYKTVCLFSLEGVQLDGDDPEHIQWIFKKSLERSSQFHIRGVTYRLTQGKRKHSIAGRLCMELFHILNYNSSQLFSYFDCVGKV